MSSMERFAVSNPFILWLGVELLTSLLSWGLKPGLASKFALDVADISASSLPAYVRSAISRQHSCAMVSGHGPLSPMEAFREAAKDDKRSYVFECMENSQRVEVGITVTEHLKFMMVSGTGGPIRIILRDRMQHCFVIHRWKFYLELAVGHRYLTVSGSKEMLLWVQEMEQSVPLSDEARTYLRR